MKVDRITGLSADAQKATEAIAPLARFVDQDREPVYAMVETVANGLTASGYKCITPGGAFPQVPGLEPDTQVYQFVPMVSQGVGYYPGDTFVPNPFSLS